VVKVFEVVDAEEQITRLNDTHAIKETIKSLQQFAMLRHYFKRLHTGEVCSVDLWHPDIPEEPRFTVSVVDISHKQSSNGQFAIFLVPHGQESNWLFSADEGLQQLAESAGYQRLVVVNLHRLHKYGSLDEVKEEVAATAVEFLQSRAEGTKKQWPVLTLGDDLGRRTVQYKGYSEFSGQFVVEDVFEKRSGTNSRRLIFLNAPRVVQTEVKLVKASKKGKSLIVDPKTLMSNYQMIMISTLGFLATEDRNHDNPVKILIIGLGGGSLSTYIDKHFKNVHIDVVELDKAMLDVATRWFGFESHDSLVTHIGDGIKFVHEASVKGEKWDVICVDVDNKDHHHGVACPPAEFIGRGFLGDVKKILTPHGYCLLNLVARNRAMQKTMVESLKQVFAHVLDCQLKEDVNEVVLLPLKLKNFFSLECNEVSKELAAAKTQDLLKLLARDAKFFDTVKSTFTRYLSSFTKL
jgi:spermidine synthase